VARAQSDLHIVWAVSTSSASSAAPVVANGLVIVATYAGVEAHQTSNGALAWKSSVSPTYGGLYGSSMFAALGSNTLVVTAVDGIHVLRLNNGSDVWHGQVAGANGSASDPIVVNDPAKGATIYVTDSSGVIALVPD